MRSRHANWRGTNNIHAFPLVRPQSLNLTAQSRSRQLQQPTAHAFIGPCMATARFYRTTHCLQAPYTVIRWFLVGIKTFQLLKLFHRPRWNYFRAIERVGNYANVTCWVRIARHVIVNLLHPFTDRIWFHFKMEPPAEIKLFYTSRRNYFILTWNRIFTDSGFMPRVIPGENPWQELP